MRPEKLTERIRIADFVYFHGGRVLSVERVTIDGEGRVKLQKTRPPVSPLWMPAVKHKLVSNES